jgi:hypothetical protein
MELPAKRFTTRGITTDAFEEAMEILQKAVYTFS